MWIYCKRHFEWITRTVILKEEKNVDKFIHSWMKYFRIRRRWTFQSFLIYFRSFLCVSCPIIPYEVGRCKFVVAWPFLRRNDGNILMKDRAVAFSHNERKQNPSRLVCAVNVNGSGAILRWYGPTITVGINISPGRGTRYSSTTQILHISVLFIV